MHDTLAYMSKDPVYRKHHHNNLTFRLVYAFSENFVLSLSHDEVVYGKGSLVGKMPGDEWQKFANMRLLLGYMYAQSGKKLLFMGGEFGQTREWGHDESLQWHLLQYQSHSGLQKWVEDLNVLYRNQPALYQKDFTPDGFEWVEANDVQNSVFISIRKGRTANDIIMVVCNFTPVPRHNYCLGAPVSGFWQELLNSDALIYGGSGQGNFGGVEALSAPLHGRPFSLTITVPPLAVVFFKPAGKS